MRQNNNDLKLSKLSFLIKLLLVVGCCWPDGVRAAAAAATDFAITLTFTLTFSTASSVQTSAIKIVKRILKRESKLLCRMKLAIMQCLERSHT